MSDLTPNNYLNIIAALKEKIRKAKTQAALSVNKELLSVYWEIGNTILEQQKTEGWGTKIIKRLAIDLRSEFPEMKGLSERNLAYMLSFATAYPHFKITQQAAAELHNFDNQLVIIMQQVAAQLPWGHHQVILDKLKTLEERLFYIQKCAENHWSRDILVHQIESGLIKRQGSLTHNFNQTIPDYGAELTQQLFKDPYNFDFLALSEKAKEQDLENALINHITKVLLELGDGFAFMGRQYLLKVGQKEYFLDLLFYHTKLRRYVIIELKIGDFMPEYIGKMNLYLGLADDTLKTEHDEPAIGLILCKTKDKIVAEYALRDTSKPIGIAEYKINELLPEDIKSELPSIEEIEQKLDEEIVQHQNPVDSRLKAIKEKLRGLKSEEIQTPATYDLLQKLFQTGLKPLYQQIINKMMSEFNEHFLTQTASWSLGNRVVHGLDEVEAFWRDEKNLASRQRMDFSYNLDGFRKSGTLSFNEHFSLLFIMDTYFYSIRPNSYSEKDIVRKLYHQPLTQADIDLIIETLMMKVMDRVEWMIGEIERQ